MMVAKSDDTSRDDDCCGPRDRHPVGTTADPQCVPGAQTGRSSIRNDSVAWFDGGESWIGTNAPLIKADGEGPRRAIRLKRFAIDLHAVSNQRFAAFVAMTGYRTEAEQLGWSYVFASFITPGANPAGSASVPWWQAIDGACWHSPEGPGSNLADREEHPVVHISWNDAQAFASWSGGRLPTEAEWEHASRGGVDDRRYPWGDQEPTDSETPCNIWQGQFPHHNTAADGYFGTAPVNAFAANPAGLFNCCGNVWEWCSDTFRVRSLSREGRTRDAQATADRERTLKGGSYLCHRSYCYRYRIAARTGRAPDTSAGHTGLRIAYDSLTAA